MQHNQKYLEFTVYKSLIYSSTASNADQADPSSLCVYVIVWTVRASLQPSQ